ncbi:DegT/DnrJ/EryC1/StrS family aminotransferase [Microbacterium lacticum]|uniref:dTDP-4-amino-4,6-dideoxygalactose transaminase n=1 Tax=Microbacterium lacticum TaxID=33885 RepID=A0A543K5A1_9MICO|nr:DegT/DnrJ/EryC1/StrS family aminotransferase [Microbacterium lacticum]TQM90252.1 dTDP-4-amino-4,6-dideoxygalactose transaminase [Microbacterium lacticum]
MSSVALYDPSHGEEECALVAEVVRSSRLSVGQLTARFEGRCADLLGAPAAVAVSSGTAALHLALMAAGVSAGDEVIMPSLTFVSGAAMVRLLGARPVFADVTGHDDLTIDPEHVLSLIGEKTRAVVVMHYGGFSADLVRLAEVCASRGVILIEDAAHAFAVSTPAGTCGMVGDYGTFSFFATKNVSIGEGGLVVARDPERNAFIRRHRSHALTTTPVERAASGALDYDVDSVGLNYRPSDISSAIALAQLDRLPDAQRAREAARTDYRHRLAALEGVVLPFASVPDDESAHHLAAILLPEGTNRNAVVRSMRTRGVQVGMHYPPTHLFSAYRDADAPPLPITEAVVPRLLSLPMHARLRTEDVAHVVEALGSALAEEAHG